MKLDASLKRTAAFSKRVLQVGQGSVAGLSCGWVRMQLGCHASGWIAVLADLQVACGA